jgi:LysR family transcriptional regulator, nitrogen assimilation regulatory protein
MRASGRRKPRIVQMELRQLRYLIGIIDFGSFSKASAQLHVAQPALSQQIAHLEIELRSILLIRSAQGITPTEAGLQLYRHAQVILRQVDQARADALGGSTGKHLVGTVSLGLPTSASTILALPLLRQVHALLPGVRLKIIESLSGHLLELLLNNRIDSAILFRETPSKGISIDAVLEEDLYAVSSDAAMANQPIHLSELSGVPLAMPGQPHAMRELIDRTFLANGIALNVIAEVDSLSALRGIAASGFATVILPQSALAEPSAEGRLCARLIVEPKISRPLSLCRPKGNPSDRATEAVIDILKQVVGELIRSGRWSGARLWIPQTRS